MTEAATKKDVCIGRYEVRKGIAAGAMASVYLAHDPKMNRPVAIKVLSKELSDNPKARQRFEHEAKTIASLKHPNIVKVFDSGELAEDFAYLVMEYVEGRHVGAVFRQERPLPESVVIAIGMELADALDCAHQHSIIHRDLKPENVFLSKGRLVLADFGIVKAIAEDSPLGRRAADPHTEVIGTPGFMAPEQLDGTPLSARTDIFSFGALLYFLSCGELPFHATSPLELADKFRNENPSPIHKIRGDFSKAFANLLHDCLEIDPNLRPPTMRRVWKRLQQCLIEAGESQPREVLRSFDHDPGTYRQAWAAKRKSYVRTQATLARLNGDETRLSRLLKRLIPESAAGPSRHAFGVLRLPLSIAAACMMLWFLGWKSENLQSVTVHSDKASVLYIDGQRIGKLENTPLTARLSKGPHEVELISAKGEKLVATFDSEPSQHSLRADWRRKRFIPVH